MPQQDTLFSEQIESITIPEALLHNLVRNGTRIQQLQFEAYSGSAEQRSVASGVHHWNQVTLPDGREVSVFDHRATTPNNDPRLRRKNSGLVWESCNRKSIDSGPRISAITSWKDSFLYRSEDAEASVRGLRSPQIGALHAIHAHWTVSDEPATVVMPTGTGKTETMLATLVSERCDRVLVIVPSVILRDQIAEKFLRLGLLKHLGVLKQTAQFPVVGRMQQILRTPEDVDSAFEACNVLVAVINSVAQCPKEALDRIAELCSHLFIDEAHHVPASSWSRVKSVFQHKRVVQFTATPYRNDGKRVDGKVIYAFPLRKAQEQGYFKPINYRPVMEFLPENSDRTIASAAIDQLRKDMSEHSFDHILMARAHPIERLNDLEDIYKELGAEFNPVIVHSGMNKAKRDAALSALRSRESRIVLCDNMLGEGFDFPQMKIAALHDIHKSLAVTLQFTGRFTRSNDPHIGPATMVVNAALVEVTDSLRSLYAQDADWNRLIQELADNAAGTKIRKTDFTLSFNPFGPDFPPENIQPKMSTVVYETTCDEWKPDALTEWLEKKQVFAGPSVSHEHNVAFFVLLETGDVEWGLAKDAMDIHYALFLLHWDKDQKLLFINSTDNKGFQQDIAKLICGEGIKLINGEQVFRVLHGINRMVLMNLGLKSTIARNIKFTMLSGADVLEGITPATTGTKIKTNLFAIGYESAERATMGCSLKGRLWSYRVASDISEWVDWCSALGKKLLDDTITVNEISKWFVVPKVLTERPPLAVLDIDWSDELYQNLWHRAVIQIGSASLPFFDVSITLVGDPVNDPIDFEVSIDGQTSRLGVRFSEDGPNFVHVSGAAAHINIGCKSASLTEFCQKYPPTIYLEGEALMERGLLFTPKEGERISFDVDRLETWDWTGVDIRKESQGLNLDADSIQYHTIQTLTAHHGYDIVFDDDDANEVADIVCLTKTDKELLVEFNHCKYSQDETPGGRIADLYEVCGQAQKSIRWRERINKMLRRLGEREAKRLQEGKHTRFMVGDQQKLVELQNAAYLLKPKLTIRIIQPGLSKALVSASQLELLGATQNYLMETYQISLDVVCSE